MYAPAFALYSHTIDRVGSRKFRIKLTCFSNSTASILRNNLVDLATGEVPIGDFIWCFFMPFVTRFSSLKIPPISDLGPSGVFTPVRG